MIHPSPDKIITSQLVHLHPKYWAANPPAIGPVTGPDIGPILQMLNASARYCSSTISLTVPGAFAIIADPASALGATLDLNQMPLERYLTPETERQGLSVVNELVRMAVPSTRRIPDSQCTQAVSHISHSTAPRSDFLPLDQADTPSLLK
jgi:hypothetical protein